VRGVERADVIWNIKETVRAFGVDDVEDHHRWWCSVNSRTKNRCIYALYAFQKYKNSSMVFEILTLVRKIRIKYDRRLYKYELNRL